MERLIDLSAVGKISQGLRELHDFINVEWLGVLFHELPDDPAMDHEAVFPLAGLNGFEVSALVGWCFRLRQLPGCWGLYLVRFDDGLEQFEGRVQRSLGLFEISGNQG